MTNCETEGGRTMKREEIRDPYVVTSFIYTDNNYTPHPHPPHLRPRLILND